MGRPKRDYRPNQIRHLALRGSQRRSVFRDEQDYRTYLRLLAKFAKMFNILIYHYCLMPNHVHLLIKALKAEISNFKHRVQTAYSKYYCAKYAKKGHVWQAHPKSKLIEDDAYLIGCGIYIEKNPLRAGLVTKCESWRWSSYRHYAFGDRDDLITDNPLLTDIIKSPKMRTRAYIKLFKMSSRKS